MTVRRVPAEYRTIQAAVEDSGPGDTVRVAGGVYQEAVVVGPGKEGLAIIGSGPGDAVLQGDGTGVGFSISGSARVTVAGFTVTGFATGIEILTTDNVIRHVAVEGSGGNGILVAASGTRNLIFQATVKGSARDGLVVNGFRNWVLSSEFRDNGGDGIDFNGPLNVAYGNRASGNGGGLNVMGNDTLVIANRFTGNGSGIAAAASAGHLVFDNVLSRNTERGASFLNVGGTLLLANTVDCNLAEGLRVDGGGGFRVVLNEVENNGAQGVDLVGAVNLSVVDRNQVTKNGAAGIRVSSAAGFNAIRRNCLSGNRPDIEALPPFNLTNVFDENRCETSVPPGLCACDR